MCFMFLFNDSATTEIYTLTLHDALPISRASIAFDEYDPRSTLKVPEHKPTRAKYPFISVHEHPRIDMPAEQVEDRKSTRLNSSHANISYAVFCLKKNIAYPCARTQSALP